MILCSSFFVTHFRLFFFLSFFSVLSGRTLPKRVWAAYSEGLDLQIIITKWCYTSDCLHLASLFCNIIILWWLVGGWRFAVDCACTHPFSTYEYLLICTQTDIHTYMPCAAIIYFLYFIQQIKIHHPLLPLPPPPAFPPPSYSPITPLAPPPFSKLKLSNLRTSRSKSHKPFFRNLVTFCTFLAVISLTPSSSFLLLLSLTSVFAVMAKRMSLGPSTNSSIALGAWSWCLLMGSMRRTRV